MAIEQNQNDKLPQRLLALLAEELKVPLELAVKSLELAELTNDISDLTGARFNTESALALVDHYALALQLANLDEGMLALEPLAITRAMREAANELAPLAKTYGVEIQLDQSTSNLPVLVNQKALTTALASAGRCVIEALAANGTGKQLTLKLASHSSRFGLVAGWYWQAEKITSSVLFKGKELLATSRQPLPTIGVNGASGVFVADMLLAAMGSHLFASRHHNWTGLAASLQTSAQLALV